MRNALLVALGGGAGSVLRWYASGWVQRFAPQSSFPWGTMAVNVTGSFAIGVLLTLAVERSLLSPPLRVLLVTGVLGGYTTFSAFSMETFEMARNGQWAAAAAYVFGSVGLGALASLAGWAVAMRM